MMERPPRPPKPAAASNAGTFLALGALLFLTGGLITLVAFVIPAVLGIVLVVAGFGLICVFHYFVWGWWLAGTLTDDDGEEKKRG